MNETPGPAPKLRPHHKLAENQWTDADRKVYREAKAAVKNSDQITGRVVETGEFAKPGVLAVLVENTEGELVQTVFFAKDIPVAFKDKRSFYQKLREAKLGSLIISDLTDDPKAQKDREQYGDRVYVTITDQEDVLHSAIVLCKGDEYLVTDWENLGLSKLSPDTEITPAAIGPLDMRDITRGEEAD